ncbi:MAG: NAD(P)-dependent oxidoreductase [Bacteroidales bacterium]|nr:NAD(P)-dependent oxidoreductase [Bacteroidales bacterium]
MKKDWLGNAHSTFVAIGASNHSSNERETNDFYATDPIAAELLLKVEPSLHDIWETACGKGHLASVFARHNKLAIATDLIDRGYGTQLDFLLCKCHHNGDIVTNPPYRYALEFVQKSLDVIPKGRKVAMFLRIQFLEGKERRKFFDENPPQTIYISTSRIKCAMNGDFKSISSSAALYAWFVWQKGWKGDTKIKWIN